jgi:hypothetical protein
MFVFSKNAYGKGCSRRLAAALEVPKTDVNVFNKYAPDKPTLLINWGRRDSGIIEAENPNVRWFNAPWSIKESSNKVKALGLLSAAGVPVIDWTTSATQAQVWYEDGCKVYTRHLTSSAKGKGIEVCSAEAGTVPSDSAKLHTKAFPNVREYRAHVFRHLSGEIKTLAVCRRSEMGPKHLEKSGIKEIDHEVRSHNRGWVMAYKDVTPILGIDNLKQVAEQALAATTLDFIAADILEGPDGEIRICEINTVPGLGHSRTMEAYVKFFTPIKEQYTDV